MLVLSSVTCQAPRPLWASRGCGHRLFLPSAGECGTNKDPTMKMLLTLEPGVGAGSAGAVGSFTWGARAGRRGRGS